MTSTSDSCHKASLVMERYTVKVGLRSVCPCQDVHDQINVLVQCYSAVSVRALLLALFHLHCMLEINTDQLQIINQVYFQCCYQAVTDNYKMTPHWEKIYGASFSFSVDKFQSTNTKLSSLYCKNNKLKQHQQPISLVNSYVLQ